MIQFQNVTKRYKDNDFKIEDVSFTIEPGEFVFLIGPSGSGKTSIIKLLIREELPTEGRIYFDDFDITRLSRNSVYKLRRQLGVVFQDYKLIPDKTVYENVAFPMEVAGKADKEIKETVPYLLDIVGLASRANAFPDHLSGGEKQRVAIARAVANNPRLLIADEPTGNLDPGAAWDIVQILTKINNWGTTVIMSTHGSDIVNTLNKRVIQMRGGKIIRDDAQGYYETVDLEAEYEIDDQIKEEAFDEQITRKGPIKMSMKAAKEEAPKKSKFFGLFGRKRKQANQFEEENMDMEMVLEETLQKPVSELTLPPKVEAELENAGFETVEDIVDAGPEGLAEKNVSLGDAELVNTAIADLVVETAREEQAPAKRKTATKVKVKTKPQKVKVDLTGNNSKDSEE